MKLSKNLRRLLEHVRDYAGTSGHDPGFYCETGRWKPYHNKTVKALVDRGLVRALEAVGPWRGHYNYRDVEWVLSNGSLRYMPDSKVFFLNLTEAGKKLFEDEEDK